MKIIIAGAGEVGTHLAKLLSQENHDITLMDTNKERLEKISEKVELITLEGSCTSLEDMKTADLNRADLFIGVTPEESKNMTACMLATKLGVKKTIARIDNDEYLSDANKMFFQALGVTSMVYPEKMAALEIISAIKYPWTRSYWELLDGSIILAGVRVREHAPICNKKLSDLSAENKLFHVVAIKRNNNTIIPNGNDSILNKDMLFFTTLKENFSLLPEIFGKNEFAVKNVMIMGGSRIAKRTAQFVSEDIKVKIIEINRERAEMISEATPKNVTVYYGDGRDVELLLSEGLRQMDAFIAVTGNSEANILTCLLAKQYGVKKTVAEIEELDFISLAENLDIGTVVNKKHATAGKIYEVLLKADASNFKCLAFANAEVGEITVQKGSKITKQKVKDLKLPVDMTLGGLIRNGKPMIIRGETMVEAGDQMVVFFLNKAFKHIEKYFN